MTGFHGEFPNFMHAEFENVAVINHRLCNVTVCVLLPIFSDITCFVQFHSLLRFYLEFGDVLLGRG